MFHLKIKIIKKGTVISILFIVVGFIFEALYLWADHIFLVAKFWLLGFISIIIGMLGLWVTTVLPIIEKKVEEKKN